MADKFVDLLEEARGELAEESRTMAKEIVKERLREIRGAERVLTKMRQQLEQLLERSTEDVDEIPE